MISDERPLCPIHVPLNAHASPGADSGCVLLLQGRKVTFPHIHLAWYCQERAVEGFKASGGTHFRLGRKTQQRKVDWLNKRSEIQVWEPTPTPWSWTNEPLPCLWGRVGAAFCPAQISIGGYQTIAHTSSWCASDRPYSRHLRVWQVSFKLK